MTLPGKRDLTSILTFGSAPKNAGHVAWPVRAPVFQRSSGCLRLKGEIQTLKEEFHKTHLVLHWRSLKEHLKPTDEIRLRSGEVTAKEAKAKPHCRKQHKLDLGNPGLLDLFPGQG